MRTLGGIIDEPLIVQEDTTVTGTVAAPAEVVQGGHLILHGTLTRDLTIRAGAVVELNGTVYGIVTNEGGKLTVRGIVYGRVVTIDGETDVDPSAVVTGDPIYPTSTVTYTRLTA